MVIILVQLPSKFKSKVLHCRFHGHVLSRVVDRVDQHCQTLVLPSSMKISSPLALQVDRLDRRAAGPLLAGLPKAG